MKFFHLSDLHLGKRVNEFSMLEDQAYILDVILQAAEREKPDGVIIAGDVYDKSTPSAEAVQLFDHFLVSLHRRVESILIVSGNHDSPERIAFGGRLLEKSGVYLSPVYNGTVAPITLIDEFGPVNIYLLPFIKPAHVRRFYPDAEINTCTDAIKTVIAHMPLDTAQRNVLVAHQFVTGATRTESEDVSLGGLDDISATLFDAFDYVALGHIHRPQSILRDTVRYCGTPLKYSFSEANDQKSLSIVELFEKGRVALGNAALTPLHDLREIKGAYEQLTFKPNYENTAADDYLHITLTDEEDVPNAAALLRVIYPNLMRLDYDNARTRANQTIDRVEHAERKSPLDLFDELYQMQNNRPMSQEQRAFAAELIEKIWEGKA